MALQDLQSQLLALTPTEKAQAIQLLAGSLGQTWLGIEKAPGVMGNDACIRQTRITVWQLETLRRQGATEADLLEDYPDLTAADLTNAWNYIALHPEEINDAIQRQEAA